MLHTTARDQQLTRAVRDALVEMSTMHDPRDAQHPVARQALVHTTQQLRRLVRGPWWPRPYQIVAAAFCALAGDRALIADDMGIGKTSSALLRVLLGALVPALVISPPSVLLNWKKECGIWLPGIPVHRLDGVDRPVPPANWPGVVITTWDLLRYHAGPLQALRPRILIADEAHYVLEESTQRSEAFDAIAAQASRILLLTGTPMKNRSSDLWRLLHVLSPGTWPEGTLDLFKKREEADFDPAAQDRLTRRVRMFMIRRKKAEALPELTAKQFRMVPIDLSPEATRQYQKLERQFAAWLDQKIRAEVAEQQPDLSGEALEDEVERRASTALAARSLVQFGALRRCVGQLKVGAATAWIVEAVRAREPVVVFAEHQPVVLALRDALRERGIPHGVIDGSTTKTRRHSLVREFQESKIDVLIASRAACEGITLTRARHVLLAERFLTAAIEDQAVDRLHRLGQTRDVSVWILCARGTIDERLDQLVGRKRTASERTVDARARVRAPARSVDAGATVQ